MSVTTLARHNQIVAAYKEHGIARAADKLGCTIHTVQYHGVPEDCGCLGQNGPSEPPEPRCCYGQCRMTLAEHEENPPKAGTYHWDVWNAQVRHS